MNIGVDAKSLSKPHTGIAVYVREIVNWMQKNHPSNNYYLFSNSDFDMPKDWKSCKKVIYSSKIPGSITVCLLLNKIVSDHNIDLFWGAEHCVPLHKSRFKKVATIHDLAVSIEPSWGTYYNSLFQKLTIKSCVKACDKVVAISKSTKEDICRLCSVNSSRISVIYNGDSPYSHYERSYTQDKAETIRRKYSLEEGYYLYCGTIEPRKNITGIVKAYNFYRKSGERKERLILCGGLGWKYKTILNEINSSPYKNDIILTGFVSEDEKEFLYRNAKAVLFPSHYEGLGLPIIEGMSCGVPVITARNSSLVEVGGDVAFYVDDENDYIAIHEMMREVANMSIEERDLVAERGRERALMFSREQCAEQLITLFKTLVG